MSTTTHDQRPVGTAGEGWAARVLVPEMWATVAIVSMWVAVLFVGVHGGDATFRNVDTSFNSIPSVVFVALFAAIGTGSVAKRVFGRPTT